MTQWAELFGGHQTGAGADAGTKVYYIVLEKNGIEMPTLVVIMLLLCVFYTHLQPFKSVRVSCCNVTICVIEYVST